MRLSPTHPLRRILTLTTCLLILTGLVISLPLATGPRATAQSGEPFGAALPLLQRGPTLPRVAETALSSRTGFVPPPIDLSHLRGEWQGPAVVNVPSRLDWRTTGKVSPVKNQGVCNACYTFASIAALESRLLIDGAGLWDFSENNAKECNWCQNGCGLGNALQVASFFAQKGTVLESCDPYVPADVACKSTCPYQKTVLDWRTLSGNHVPATDALKNAIATYGPIHVTLYIGNGDAWADEFSNYDGSYTLYYPGTQAPNHAVLIVGWDDDLVHAGGRGGWIVKNSWGTGWGGTAGYGSEGGYFTIAYGAAQIGQYAGFPYQWQDYDPGGAVWYYDEGGFDGSVGYNKPTAWALAKFIPPANTRITRVEFWTTDVTTDVDVYLYDQFDGTTLGGLLASKLNLTFDSAGYHSVALNAPVAVTAGNDVIAVIKVTNASYGYPIAIDSAGPHEIGKTYMSSNGSAWDDVGTDQAADVALRLRTSSQPVAPTATASPTATRTVTPTVTRTAGTATATRTRAPGSRLVHLPLVLRAIPIVAPTATPTATRTRTPTPTATRPPFQGIFGWITYNGAPAAGIPLRLRFYNGAAWSDAAITTTDPAGRYAFMAAPSLAVGQGYYVFFGPNQTNPNYVAGWGATTITTYVAGTSLPGGDFDIANVNLLSPPPGSALPLPVTLAWQRRGIAGDSYRVILFDPESDDGWLSIALGDVGSITLTSLPAGTVYSKVYGWLVRVYTEPDSYGESYYYRLITFLSGGQAQTSALIWGSADRGAMTDRFERGRVLGQQERPSE